LYCLLTTNQTESFARKITKGWGISSPQYALQFHAVEFDSQSSHKNDVFLMYQLSGYIIFDTFMMIVPLLPIMQCTICS